MEFRASRKLGQNFLADTNLARAIVGELGADNEETVVEVGPGLGAMSHHLAGRKGRTVLVEFDARLADRLRERLAGDPGVEVVTADAARFDTRELFPDQPVLFLGNLPYSAGGAILARWFRHPTPVAGGVVLLQKEFVDRMAAGPRSKDYGVLSVRLQMGWRVRRVREVGPDAFVPRPRVSSTLAALEPLPDDHFPVHDRELADRLVRMGFAQRRKQLHRQIPLGDRAWPDLARQLGVAESVRAEELEVGQWVELARLLDPHPLGTTPQRDDEIFDVVDEDDVVTGQATRAEVHARGWRHRAVHVLVFNKKGEVLLQKRSRLKDVHPGAWDSSAAGHLDAGESYAGAAKREIEEELGMAVEGLEEIGRLPATAETGWEHVAVFRAEGNSQPRFPCGEIEACLWMRQAEVNRWIARRPEDFAGGFLASWRRADPRR